VQLVSTEKYGRVSLTDSVSVADPDRPSASLLGRLRRVGPAIVVAAVVLGPGSIVTASRVGCEYGYDLLWVVPVAGILMMAMTAAAMVAGVCGKETLCQAVATSFGRPAAVLVGVAILVAITLFQASNNNALLMAAEGFMGDATNAETSQGVADAAVDDAGADDDDAGAGAWTGPLALLLVNVAVVVLLVLGRRDLYRLIERCMAVLIGAMVCAFALSMFAAAPDVTEIAAGLVPSMPDSVTSNTSGGGTVSWLSIAALMATTFSVAAAFYQSYQVREKGWTEDELAIGLTDSVVGISTLGLITAMILVTAASALHGVVDVENLTSAAVVAKSLEPMFGAWARIVFAVGVLAGAVSSFVVNAVIGGVVFSDAIGTGSKMSDIGVRRATIASLLLGWTVAAGVAITGVDLVSFIVVAQSLCILAFPVLAVVIVWQFQRVGPSSLVRLLAPVCWIGVVVVVLFSANTVSKLVAKYRQSASATATESASKPPQDPKVDVDVLK